MISSPFHKTALPFLLAAQLLMAGCWGGDSETKPPPEPALKEIPTTDTKEATNASEAELFYRSKKYFETGVYSEAKQSLQSLLSNFPLGAYAEFSEIKLADSSFETGDYPAAATHYEELYKSHPASESTPYVLFRAARSNHLAQRGLGRDIATLEKAVKLYDELDQKYPQSTYAISAREYRAEAHDLLARYEISVAEFYRNHDKDAAADAREKDYEAKWAPVLKDDEKSLRQATAARNARIEEVAASLPALPTPAPVPSEGGAPETAVASIPDAGHIFSQVECIEGDVTQVSILLDKSLDDADFLEKYRSVATQDGKLNIKLPDVAGRAAEQRCSNGVLIQMSSTGELTISGDSLAPTAQLLTMDNPPRLILLLR